MSKIDLVGNPFFLDENGEKWVKDTLASMSEDEKIGQLFFQIGFDLDPKKLEEMLNVMKPGGIMFRSGPSKEIYNIQKYIQDNSKIPLMLAANLEAGGDGLISEGTKFGNNMFVGATNDPEQAKRLGIVCGTEAQAVGGNVGFAPVIDINYNFRNPITNTRSFGDRPELIAEMGKAYIKGMHETNSLVTIKHFPGDGCDGRDQHLTITKNSLCIEDWHKTYGYIYKECIDAGARGLMVGHISLASYINEKYPNEVIDSNTPASLSPELLNGLLREELGFNGLTMTDATLMAGFGAFMEREKAVPYSIQAGCDQFLFCKNWQEDLKFMKQGLKNGILTYERLDEAVTRILAAKASLKLHEKENLVPGDFYKIGCSEHKEWASEAADKSVTLVKDDQNLLPIDKTKIKKIGVFAFGNERGMEALFDNIPGLKGKLIKTAMRLKNGKPKPKNSEIFMNKLRSEGFEVEHLDHSNPLVMMGAMKESMESLKSKYDMIIYLIQITPMSNGTHLGVAFESPIGSDAPWFVKDIPTMTISLGSPYHNYDLDVVPTFVNAYMATEVVMDSVINKVLGKSEFKGVSPVKTKLTEFTGNISEYENY